MRNPPYSGCFLMFCGSQSHIFSCRHETCDLLTLVSFHYYIIDIWQKQELVHNRFEKPFSGFSNIYCNVVMSRPSRPGILFLLAGGQHVKSCFANLRFPIRPFFMLYQQGQTLFFLILDDSIQLFRVISAD